MVTELTPERWRRLSALLEAHQILSASDAGLAPVAARRLAELYETWGNPEKAAEWRAEAASR